MNKTNDYYRIRVIDDDGNLINLSVFMSNGSEAELQRFRKKFSDQHPNAASIIIEPAEEMPSIATIDKPSYRKGYSLIKKDR